MAKKALPDVNIVHNWTTDDVIDWLLQAEFGECTEAFRKRDIDGASFLTLTEESFLLWAGDIKIRQRMQITRYLNDCRTRDSSNQGIKSALKLKKKSPTEPPPVPQPDYTGSIADDDSYDEGWDTDFDEDSEEEKDIRESESRHRRNICSPEDLSLALKSRELGENHPVPSSVGKQIAEIIRKFNLEPPPAMHNDNKSSDKDGTLSESQDIAAQRHQPPMTTTTGRPELPKRKVLPRPPNLPLVLTRLNPRPQSTDAGSKLSLARPHQQPPPPPPPLGKQPLSTSSPCSTPTSHPDFDQSLDSQYPAGPIDAYEVPTPSQSDAGSMDLNVATSMNSLSISGDSSMHGNMHESLSQSQFELCQELVMEEAYEIPDESQWSGSSGVSSTSSDRPALPPKPCSPEVVPPPLPEKPQRRIGIVNGVPSATIASPAVAATRPPIPIKDNNRPPLPSRKTSDDWTAKARNRPSLDGCKQRIKTSLTSMLSNLGTRLTAEKRADSVDKVTTPDKDLSTLEAATEMTKSYSMLSLRQGMTDGANRPLPPVPNLNKNNARNSQDGGLPAAPAIPEITSTQNALSSQPWFHKVEREAAATTLRQMGQSGSYLVRESHRNGKSNPYSLTVYYDEKVSHLNIRKRSDDTFALGKEKDNEKTFSSVEELITYHQREPILLTAQGHQIGKTWLVTHPDK